MECNKDEALRAKEIAEKKFEAKDIAGAKKFALKAHALYPGLEGISQMLATFDVYISAENRTNGEADWYAILGVASQADEDTVRKQYRKLALMLHPDKNKSVGAEGAFKFISEAWSLLSDKNKRAAYDQKRNPRVFQQKVTPPSEGPAAATGDNGFYNFAKTTSTTRVHKNSSRANNSSTGSAHKGKSQTFWTVCHRCKMQYEYLRVYLNHNLLCPNCRQPFMAVETPPPVPNGYKSSTPWNSSKLRQSSNYQEANKTDASDVGSGAFKNSDANAQWTPFARTTGASTVAQAASVVQQTYEKVKREREEAQAAKKREKAMKRKSQVSEKMGGVSSAEAPEIVRKRRMHDASMGSVNHMGLGTGESGISIATVPGHGNSESVDFNGHRKPSSVKELPQIELRKMLMEKARKEIRKRLSEWKSASNRTGEQKARGKAHDKDEGNGNTEMNGATCNHKDSRGPDPKDGLHSDKPAHGPSGRNLGMEKFKPMSINVPDPDFYDFDKDRTEKSFGENQVWAAYDDDDGMPRFYAIVHSIVSRTPFEMRISWLNSKTNSELGPLNWVGSGFTKTCGELRIGRYEIYSSLNAFSHKVRWKKGTRGVIRIFPGKGDVWALYRNWSPDWNELTPDDIIHEYDMVEVLEDYDEELGVAVTPLVKVAGFKTVFHQHLDPKQVRRIPREEMFRFSHQVPSHLLTGQEAPNAPKGCRELDPAATPYELLEVIPDLKGEDLAPNEPSGQEQSIADAVKKAGD